jgi:hypothetical protein
MGQPILTHESRCLVILAGRVLERCIEDRARTIVGSRSSDVITPEDIKKATTEFLREDLSNLPDLLQHAMDKSAFRSSKAA